MITAGTCSEILERVAETELEYYELAGRNRGGFSGEFDDPEPRPNMEVFINQEPQVLTVRLRLAWSTTAMDMRADAAVRFKMSDNVEAESSVLHDFVRRVGVPYVFPYLRVPLDDLARKFGLPDSGISILRMDQFTLTNEVD